MLSLDELSHYWQEEEEYHDNDNNDNYDIKVDNLYSHFNKEG